MGAVGADQDFLPGQKYPQPPEVNYIIIHLNREMELEYFMKHYTNRSQIVK
jgi:hypothetical protein